MFLCCCTPSLEHNECLKFKLMFTNVNETGEFSIYPKNTNIGALLDLTPYEIGHSKFPCVKIYGRNKDMYKIFYHLT